MVSRRNRAKPIIRGRVRILVPVFRQLFKFLHVSEFLKAMLSIFKLRLPFFNKGVHSFFLIFSGEEGMEHSALE